MRIHPIRAADLARTPWKNGGGTTAEIAVMPRGATFDSFDWRVSMAEVASDGPFSSFPAIERTLVLVDGAGIELTVADQAHRLDTVGSMLSFPGDAPASGRLVDGPVRDLNIMTRRGRATHRVRLATPGEVAVERTTLILAHVAPTTVTADDGLWRLDRFDAAMCSGPGVLMLSGPAILAHITSAAAL